MWGTRLPIIDLFLSVSERVKESKGPLSHVWPCDIGIPSPGTREVWIPELYLPWIGFESTNAQLVCQAAVSSPGSDGSSAHRTRKKSGTSLQFPILRSWSFHFSMLCLWRHLNPPQHEHLLTLLFKISGKKRHEKNLYNRGFTIAYECLPGDAGLLPDPKLPLLERCNLRRSNGASFCTSSNKL